MSEAPPAWTASVSCSGEGCSTLEADDAEAALCPVSRTIGLTVDLITVKALLKGSALRRLEGKTYRFCPARDCDVVYFNRERHSIFEKHDLAVRVGQKETEDPIPLCYCFDFTVADVRARGARISEVIAAEIKAGHCACEVKNPQGSCCLGNVTAAVRSQSPPCPQEVDGSIHQQRRQGKSFVRRSRLGFWWSFLIDYRTAILERAV